MKGLNILIAEDDKDIRNLLQLQLEESGYTVFSAKDGMEAFLLFEKNPVDLAIFDVNMPRLDGFNLLRKIRENSNLPVIFLTARGEEMDKILGLGLGADDYLVKPFSMGELMARVGAQLRRLREYGKERSLTKGEIVSGAVRLDTDACCLYHGDSRIELNAKEYLLLKHLMENQEKVLTKKQLYKAVWDEEYYYDDNTIMVHISRLRNKMEKDPKSPVFIRTVRGIGYKFQKQPEVTG